VQRDLGLGPNGGLVYAMEYVAANLDWLQDRVQPLLASGTYLLLDCPGQVELFNVHDALHKIVLCLTDKLRIRCARARECSCMLNELLTWVSLTAYLPPLLRPLGRFIMR
jgi:Conserved hypothetical ATP binding protein